MQRVAAPAGNNGRVRSTPAVRRQSSATVQQKRTTRKSEASAQFQSGGSCSSTSLAETQAQKAWLELPDAMRLLVQQPLLQLRAELRVEEDDSPQSLTNSRHAGDSSLSCLSIFLRRMLQALLELQQLVDASRPMPQMPGVSAMMQWLARTREELCLWGQRAGRAVRTLAGSSQKLGGHEPKELGNHLHSFLQELSQLRQELQQSKGQAAQAPKQEAKGAILAANEAAEWRRSVEELLVEKFKDFKAADERNWHNLREEITRSKESVLSELAEQQNHNVKQLSELMSLRDRQRDRELQLLREHTETAMLEVKSSIGSVHMASYKAQSEQQALAAAEARFTELLQAERLSHREILANEQREKSALALQLTEAMDAVSTKDHSIEHLRKSLSEVERARPEPVQTALSSAPRLPSLPVSGVAGSAGPIPPSPKASAMEPVARMRSPGKVPERPHMQLGGFEDGSASVCRVSTESTPFQSIHPSDPVPSRRTVMDSATAPTNHGAGVPTRPKVLEQQAPWDLPPEEFLSLWRQSQASAAFAPRSRIAGGSEDLKPGHSGHSPSHSTDTLRITASWD